MAEGRLGLAGDAAQAALQLGAAGSVSFPHGPNSPRRLSCQQASPAEVTRLQMKQLGSF